MKKLILLFLLFPLFGISQITFPNSSKQQGYRLFMGPVKVIGSFQIGVHGPQIDSTGIVGGVFLFYKAGVAYNLATGNAIDTISLSNRINSKVSFPGFGTTSSTAAVGNDSRLSDSRTPTAHNQAQSTITNLSDSLLTKLNRKDSTKYATNHRVGLIEVTLASGTELSGLVPLKADSNKTDGSGYATPKYVLDHAGYGSSFADSLSVLASPPATGNIYIDSTSGRLWVKSNSYWKSPVWAADSVSASGYFYGPELVVNGSVEGTYVAGNAPSWTYIAGNLSENTATPYAGTSSQSITNAAGLSGQIWQMVPTTSGDWYVLSFYAKNIKATGGALFEASSTQFSPFTISSSSWTLYTVIFQSSGTHISPYFQANVDVTNDTNGICFDQVSVKKILNY